MTSARQCPVCRGSRISVFFEMEGVPVFCNVLWPTREDALRAPTGDIRLGYCHGCGLIYNGSFDPSRVSYAPGYENSLHVSPHFQEYAKELAQKLVGRYGIHDKEIIEIGCGGGEFLALLCAAGDNKGTGFDASWDESVVGSEERTGVTIVPENYSAAHEHLAADLYCCRHVLEHIPDPAGFLGIVKASAARRANSKVFFEVPNVMFTLKDMGTWDIIYEHCSYYSRPSLERLFREVGFTPEDTYSAYDGQFLCIEASVSARGEGGADAGGSDLEEMATLVMSFSDHYSAQLNRWRTTLRSLSGQAKTVALWGAGSKGVTFLNAVAEADKITRVVDINPKKRGKYIPGTGHRVLAPESLTENAPDAVVVLNPVYQPEIQGTLERLRLRPELVVA